MQSKSHILSLIRERVRHPASIKELIQALDVPRHERAAFRRQIKALAAEGDLVQVRGHRFGLPDKMDLIVGRLQAHPNGFGFVTPERTDTSGEDLYIPAGGLLEAMHGDRVVARVESRKPDGRTEGRIVEILERGQASVVGRLDVDPSGFAFVKPFDRRVLLDVIVSGAVGSARRGEMVLAEITRFPAAGRNPVGRVVRVFGDVNQPGVDVDIIIHKHGIVDAHSEQARAEAQRIGPSVRPRDLEGRTDFRSVPTVTIDGDDARDFDDAITIERLANGNVKLGVHIADVAHYVHEDTALDEEAYERATSVYFPERAVHMFPSELSTGLCSLNPDVDRLVQSCVMEVDGRGQVVRYELHDGIINSDARMTYTDVNAILTDRDAATIARYESLTPTFELMAELFHTLHARRHRRGSIDFDLRETEVVLDDQGLVEAIIASERNIAHRIIEEFMLLANETVAAHLAEHVTPTLYRIHEAPDPLKVEQFEDFISTFEYTLGASTDKVHPRHFQQIVERMKGSPEEKPIAFLMLRTMQKARYDPANRGHFGLAADCYTHFTSPIRRYPDLVVHRTLRELRHGLMDDARKEEWTDALQEIARHTSERERRADEAEMELMQWKKVRFMADKVGDEYEGYVTGVAPFGLFVELVEHFVEGLVHVSSMADDYYRFLERRHTMIGENTKKTYRLGDRVQVQVVRVNLDSRQIELGLVEILDAVRAEERRRGPRRSKAADARPRGRAAKTPPSSRNRPGRRERQAKRRR